MPKAAEAAEINLLMMGTALPGVFRDSFILYDIQRR
jgi:hypothetical protein